MPLLFPCIMTKMLFIPLCKKKSPWCIRRFPPPFFFHIKNGLRSLPSPSAWELAGLWILITSNPLDPKEPFHSPYHSRRKRKNHLLPAKIARASTKRKKKRKSRRFFSFSSIGMQKLYTQGKSLFFFFKFYFGFFFMRDTRVSFSPFFPD